MKKLLSVLLCFSFLFSQAQTVDAVITKYADYMGGLKAFNTIKTAKMTGMLSVQGMDLPLTITIINGKAGRSDAEVMNTVVISAYKDGKGWKQNEFAGAPTPTDASDAELLEMKAMSNLASTLMNYKALGHQVELQGQEDVDGTKAYKVKLISKDDKKASTYFINSADYSLIKMITEREIRGAPVDVETYYSDVKEVKGVKFYMSRVQKSGGEEISAAKFDNVELDIPVDEKIFDKP